MPEVDLIVPTIKGREASLERCLESFERLTDEDLNEIVVKDSETCGQGWIEGLRESKAPYVALIADDLELTSGYWAAQCIEAVELGLLPCPRVFRPDGSIESQGGDMNAYGHILARHTKDGVQVDFTTIPFMSREQVDAIGMIGTQYACDTWVSYRGRQLGWDTALVHGYDFIHHQEQVGRGAGMPQNERDAMDTKTMLTELDHASHTPTLRAVMEEIQPKRVLELGSGRYSTNEFLHWPSVERFLSLETDPFWVQPESNTEHFEIRLVEDTVAALPDLADFDLVFVDNANNEHDRELAIRAVLGQEHPVVVIHDAENPAYRKAIEDHANGNVTYSNLNPQTAVVR